MSPAKVSAVITPAFLSALRSHPHLPTHSWYFIAGVTLSAINRPDEIPTVFNYALEHGVGPAPESSKPAAAEQLQIARRLREGLVKSAAVVGLPKQKTINGLFALKTATPAELLDEPMGYSPSARPVEVYDVPSSQILHRGQRFFDAVYGKVSKRVMGQMDRSGTEDLGVVARLMYGYLLSNTAILSPAESSFVLMAALIPQDVNPQLKGHLKGAVNNGATVDEVRAVRDIVIRICEASGMTRLQDNATGGWGWRSEVANL
ncbi:AhpD-like protein [Lineolata rhizophorae]|uniref:AhpD-like protein n=1 Tax=Lineolata rhizophorae TaxID=578093 RepID=A0A6A6PCS5_9PEZI|nr:AhpD-like protein [Lineolata rhizophorae]